MVVLESWKSLSYFFSCLLFLDFNFFFSSFFNFSFRNLHLTILDQCGSGLELCGGVGWQKWRRSGVCVLLGTRLGKLRGCGSQAEGCSGILGSQAHEWPVLGSATLGQRKPLHG